jgi:hypothetical protein
MGFGIFMLGFSYSPWQVKRIHEIWLMLFMPIVKKIGLVDTIDRLVDTQMELSPGMAVFGTFFSVWFPAVLFLDRTV